MVNINGKEWSILETSDIQTVIDEHDFSESFYFEFKADEVKPQKLVEEISAFANTFGGYIFIGISDDKKIEGCNLWDEQRIHTTIHDSITPTPSFDVKKFTFEKKTVYIIKIDEGSEPPYITSAGKIYERISSGSYTIKDSVRLSQIYSKREQLLTKMENKISIPSVFQNTNNIYGYIDTGYVLTLSDSQVACDIFNKIDLREIAKKMSAKMDSSNIVRVGNSILYTPGGLSISNGNLPAHTNNFLEIMADGSAKMRILLVNNDPSNPTVNMIYARIFLNLYQEVYTITMGELFPEKMVYAKKYESLTVLKQFHPVFLYDEAILKAHPDWSEKNKKMLSSLREYRKTVGKDIVVTNDRIPKNGLYTIDKREMEKWGRQYTADSILDELFYSSFVTLGFLPVEMDSNDTDLYSSDS